MVNRVVLAAEGLSKIYVGDGYQVQALKKTSIELREGEFVVIMGTSGSGKSTLLNLVGALDVPDSGHILLDGEEVTDVFQEPHSTHYRSEYIGFIFQSYHLLKDLTVEENIALPLILKDVPKHEVKKAVSKMLDDIGLSRWRKHKPVQLSGGQQQRVAIGRALITSPRIVLADEPTGNLDYNTSAEILNLLNRMQRQYRQTILMVTHDPVVATYGDRVLFFHDGQVVDEYICRKDKTDMDQILNRFRQMLVRTS
jgi:putative ABC transport system ATP-binding protein